MTQQEVRAIEAMTTTEILETLDELRTNLSRNILGNPRLAMRISERIDNLSDELARRDMRSRIARQAQ